jgi:hypothetical protein
MIRTALLFSAGLLAAACFACVQQQAVVPPPPPPPAAVRTVDCSSADNFARSVQTLDASFTPNPDDPSAPTSNGSVADPNMLADLSAAFSLAPQPLRNALCGAGGNPVVTVFIQSCPAGSTVCAVGSWGYRTHRGLVPFIGLSAGLWQPGPHAMAYSKFEQTVIDSLLGTNLGESLSASNDSPGMTVLAVLAHEMGHILAFRKSVLNQPCQSVLPPGVNPIFWRNGWANASDPGKFHVFGVQMPGDSRLHGPDKDHVNGDPTVLAQIYGIIPYPPPNPPQPPQLHSDWASLLANVAPDEDLIETYKLMILQNANNLGAGNGPLTSLIITIRNVGNVDIIQELFPDRYGLRVKKATWVQNCFL